jgi:NitT/TauT family transport system substrate-binding protein
MSRIVLAFVAAILLALDPAAAEPTKIRIAYSSLTGQLTALMPHMPKEVLTHWGRSYVVEPIFIQGSGPMLTAVAAKEADFANYSYQSFVNGIVEAKIDMRIIEEALSDKPPNYATGYWVNADSTIRKIEDLRGKTVGINARGSTNEAAMRKMLSEHGLTDGKDYQIVEARFDALMPTLKSKRVDLAFLVLPFGLIAEKSGEFRKLFAMRDSLGTTQTVVLGGLSEFVAKNRPALVDFLEDELRMRRWLYDERNRPAMLEIVTRLTKQPAERFADWIFTRNDLYRDINGEVDPVVLQRNVDDLQKLGLTKDTIDVAKHLDMSLVKEAAKRIAAN